MTSTSMMPIETMNLMVPPGWGISVAFFLSKIIPYKHHNHLIIPYKTQIP